ncbi:response regulator [Vibrio sp.]|nr:response regulator [Vibrio sp.]
MVKEAQEVSILLIEDDDVDAMSIERSFRKKRISNPIIRAYDGIEALEFLNNENVERPIIILLDLQLPRMNGIEFLKRLRADEKLTDLVVFVLTTSKAEEDIVASYKQHIAGYFVKGETGAGFLSVVDMLDCYWKVVYLPKK